ncbi:hypothetical protein NIES22_58740 [Calothrix brevissima NIES-22]|nr:hypothetical protein NIES22_58740 [Calothrix brevissima NIES-22]
MSQRLGSVVFGGIFLLVGLLFLWEGLPHTHSVTCKHTPANQVDCQCQERIFWWIPIKTVPLRNLQAVRMGKGENAYDSTVYFISLKGEGSNLMFGNTLNLEDIQGDLLKAQQFLKDGKTQSLTLERYEAQYFFAIMGFLLSILGFQIITWKEITKSKYS